MPEDAAAPEELALPARPDRAQPITPRGYRRLASERSALEPSRYRAQVIDQILATVEVIAPAMIDGAAGFGCEIEVEDESAKRRVYTLVGPDEGDPTEGFISTTSPLGKALLGHRVTDVIEWKRNGRDEEWEVVDVRLPTEVELGVK